MAEVQAIINALSNVVATIPGMHSYPKRPFTVDAPAAIYRLYEIDFDSSMDRGSDEYIFFCTLFTSMASDSGEAALYSYLSPDSSTSIKRVIEADPTLGGTAIYATIDQVKEPGIANFGSAQFYAVDIRIRVGV